MYMYMYSSCTTVLLNTCVASLWSRVKIPQNVSYGRETERQGEGKMGREEGERERA